MLLTTTRVVPSDLWFLIRKLWQPLPKSRISLRMVDIKDRFVSTILMTCLAASLLSVQIVAHAAGTDHAPVAGCHHSGSHLPAPPPTDYRCCSLGHHPAALPTAFAPQAPIISVYWLTAREPSQTVGAIETTYKSAEKILPQTALPLLI